MNVNAIICQVGQLTGTLHHGGMTSYSNDDLRLLADSLELARNIVFAELRHRLDAEREANPSETVTPSGGLLAYIGRKDGGAA
jgi:hypothetical protein